MNYNLGPVHKLITIGTPHTGTQLAFDLLPGPSGDPNFCVRDALELSGEVSLLSATLTGGQVVDGAVGDLRATSLPNAAFPIAYIGATTGPTTTNLNGLDMKVLSASWTIYNGCGIQEGNPLARLLTNNPVGAWNQEFAGAPNDAIVPLTSQLSGESSALVFPGVIHSRGIEDLDFIGPSEVDSGSGIPDEVINLLNEQTTGSDFFPHSGSGGSGGSGSSS